MASLLHPAKSQMNNVLSSDQALTRLFLREMPCTSANGGLSTHQLLKTVLALLRPHEAGLSKSFFAKECTRLASQHRHAKVRLWISLETYGGSVDASEDRSSVAGCISNEEMRPN